ncbi:MAG: MFS transporter, partial [Alphaproteobacteria bacterium]
MNKFERHSPAGKQILPETAAGDPSQKAVEVIDISDAPATLPRPPLTRSEVRTILMSLMLTMFLAALDQTIVATALPTIGGQFHDVSNLSWVITAYLLASTAVAPVFGTLSDIYGRRAMIITALSLFIAGSILCALAPNMPVLIAARGLQGLGGGGIMPIVQTVISDLVTPRERGQYQAYFSSVWMAAGIGGPILGGVFAEHLHWSMIFWINVPLGLASLALLLPKMSKIPVFHRRRKIDWLGGVLLMASAVVFMMVLTWGGNRYLWLSPEIMAMVGAALALALAFVWQAGRAEEPFLPLPLLGGKVVPYAMGAGGCAMGAMNFFRALMASFTVAAFTAILLMALGADISLSGEHRGPVTSIPADDMIAAFRYVFAAAAALLICAALCVARMEEKPLAGPP